MTLHEHGQIVDRVIPKEALDQVDDLDFVTPAPCQRMHEYAKFRMPLRVGLMPAHRKDPLLDLDGSVVRMLLDADRWTLPYFEINRRGVPVLVADACVPLALERCHFRL